MVKNVFFWVVGVTIVVVGLLFSFLLTYTSGKQAGVDFLFEQCYTIGGAVYQPSTGRFIGCAPLGTAPEEERPHIQEELDKLERV